MGLIKHILSYSPTHVVYSLLMSLPQRATAVSLLIAVLIADSRQCVLGILDPQVKATLSSWHNSDVFESGVHALSQKRLGYLPKESQSF